MRAGDTLENRFVIVHLAGSGGMGEVYRALDQQTGLPVAIKVLRGESDRGLSRFQRETRLLQSIEHPGIVRYIGHGLAPSGGPYLVMEWLDGEELGARIAQGPLAIAEALELVTQVADALGALHDGGIVHRDLKPSNIFLVRGKTTHSVKLLDFGIARSESASRLTGTGMILGTASYMAPEQANGPHTSSSSADVFSLGCVLFECLTGEKAFDGAHFMAILTKILFDDPPPLQSKCPNASVELCALVERMLSKSPQERPAHGREVAEALRNIGNTPALAIAATVHAPASGLLSLTTSEKRALAVILIGASNTHDPTSGARLAMAAEAFGGRFERLFDGSAAVFLSGPQIATDLAAQAARCALALKRHAPEQRIVLAMGRADETRHLQLGPAIDRASKWLGAPTTERWSSEYVILDEASVGLLDARFELLEEGGAFVLRAERDIIGVRTLLGKPTPCVGRERELRQIMESFEECVSEERARAILVTGSAGMGKSRIGREIIQRVRNFGDPVSIWVARAELLGAGSALSMLAELVREACGCKPGDSVEVQRQRIRDRVDARVSSANRQRIIEFLGEIVGAQFPDENSLPLRMARQDAQGMADQMRSAFIDFLRSESENAPVFILLEDLHWGDASTVRILDAALRVLAEKPVFVLALARPEVHDVFPKLWAERAFEEKRLPQLSKKASEQLVRHILGNQSGSETCERIVRLADGNAFYLEELIRATAEGKGANLPETVVAMVQSRLGRLPETQRRMLRAASIFGETFWTAGLIALLGGAVATTHATIGMRDLVEAELVAERNESLFPGEDEYVFRHALIREGAYAMLTEEDRCLGHRLAGVWLEQHGARDPVVLAEHFAQGGEGEKASRFYLQAAEAALRGNDADAAIRYTTRGLANGAVGDVRIDLLGVLCEANMYTLTTIDIALGHAEQLLQIAAAGSLPWTQGAIMALMGSAAVGRNDFVAQIIERIRHVEPTRAAVGLMVQTILAGAILCDWSGQVRQGNSLHDRATELVASLPEQDWRAELFLYMFGGTRHRYAREDPWGAYRQIQEALRLAVLTGNTRFNQLTQLSKGLTLCSLGFAQDAEQTLHGITLSNHEMALASSFRPFLLALMHIDRGEFDAARLQAGHLLNEGIERGISSEQAHGHWALAEIFCRTGDFDAAEHHVMAAHTIAMPIERPGMLATLAAIRLGQGRLTEALATADEGMAQYEKIGACSVFFRAASLRVVHAECLKANERHEEARTAIAKSKEWLLAIANKIDADEVRKTFLECVPENRRILDLETQWESSSNGSFASPVPTP